MKQVIKSLIYRNPALKKTWNIFKYLRGRASIVSIAKPTFDGWNLVTGTRTPWTNGGGHQLTQQFGLVDASLKKLVKDRNITLTQFLPENVSIELETLTWRHYIVYWSVHYAFQNTAGSVTKNLAEFGVCDGLTAFYAGSAAKNFSQNSKFYLYDAWDGMRPDLLTDSEKSSAGSYAYLDLENTKNNLSTLHSLSLVFNKGYIPEVFASADNPETLIWFHIDLNSAAPTIQVLEKFWDQLVVGGVVLFDDFGWPGYEDTQNEIEKWMRDRRCNMLQIPTGQAILFKLEQA
jgi:O-methyltransferase